ncbi:MAG: hypothetical protein ACLQD9_05210 [Thermoplasmata archaeon]
MEGDAAQEGERCSMCAREFGTAFGLEQHNRRIHGSRGGPGRASVEPLATRAQGQIGSQGKEASRGSASRTLSVETSPETEESKIGRVSGQINLPIFGGIECALHLHLGHEAHRRHHVESLLREARAKASRHPTEDTGTIEGRFRLGWHRSILGTLRAEGVDILHGPAGEG